jgi:hypothetical protein
MGANCKQRGSRRSRAAPPPPDDVVEHSDMAPPEYSEMALALQFVERHGDTVAYNGQFHWLRRFGPDGWERGGELAVRRDVFALCHAAANEAQSRGLALDAMRLASAATVDAVVTLVKPLVATEPLDNWAGVLLSVQSKRDFS